MSKVYGVIARNPVRTFAIVQAAVAAAVAFGLHLTGDQTAAIMAFAAVVLGLSIPPTVTPNAKLNAPPEVP